MNEPDVVRRLADIAAATTVDPEAWSKISERIAELPPGHRPHRPMPHRLMVAAAAAVVVTLCVAAILTSGDDGGDRVRTIDDPTTTVAPDPPRTSQPTTTAADAGTSVPEVEGPAGDSPPNGDPTGAASPTGTSPGPAGATMIPPSATPTRLSPVATISSTQGFDVELVYSANTVFVRRTDDIGSTVGPPDGYGSFDAVSWGEESGAGCMTWGGNAYVVPGATQPEVIVFGLVGSAATQFRVVMADGTPVGGQVGPVVEPGLRVWVANLPDGPIDHVEARDAQNDLLAAIGNPTPGVPTAVQC